MGLLAFGLAEPVAAVLATVAGVACLVGLRRTGVPSPATLQAWRLANASALSLTLIAAFLLPQRLLVGASLVAWLLVHRAATGRTPADDRVALLLALLLLLLSCILGFSPVLGLVFVAFAIMAPIGLLRCHLDEAAPDPRVGAGELRGGALRALGPVVLGLTIPLFFLLPRVQGGIGAGDSAAALPGFQDRVDLGAHAMSRMNPDEVLRVVLRDERGEPVPAPVYMRGMALDVFDGKTWERSPMSPVALGYWPENPGTDRYWRAEIIQSQAAGGTLFGPPEVHAINPPAGEFRVRADLSRNFKGPGREAVIRYTVYSLPLAPGEVRAETAPIRQREAGLGILERAGLRSGLWLELPPDLDPRIPELARKLAEDAGPGADPLMQARSVMRHLSGFEYTLLPQPEHADQPLAGFLFESRAGHCEYFATALTLLLRAQGTPARLVNGLYGGEWNRFGEFLVFRQEDAHSWVEAWIDGRWVTLDATPEAPPDVAGLVAELGDVFAGGWQILMLDYDLAAQVEAARGVSALLSAGGVGGLVRFPAWARFAVLTGLLGAAALLVQRGLGFLAGRTSKPRLLAIERVYAQGLRAVNRRGWSVDPQLPPVSAAERLVAQVGPRAEPLLELAWLVYRVRYGGEPEESLLGQARETCHLLKGLPERRS